MSLSTMSKQVATSSKPMIASSSSNTASNLSPVALGNKIISQYIQRDAQFPELDRIIQQSSVNDYIFSPDPESLGAFIPFERTETLVLPDIVFEQYNSTECYTRMGLLPEINRAWISVDNRLFFWNYLNGEDFLSFDSLDQTILSVSLAKPKPDTFISSVEHLLLISTPTQFVIIAISIVDGELELFDTGMSTSIQGLHVGHICALTSGRIFIGSASSTDIWEIVYKKREGWFSGKCYKVCQTSSSLSHYMPSFDGISAIFSSKPEGKSLTDLFHHKAAEYIIQMKVDNTRSALYTLSNKSTIRAYSIGKKGEFQAMYSYTYRSMVTHSQLLNVPAVLLDPYKVSLVSIHPIPVQQSQMINLVAVTSTGVRLYMRISRSFFSFQGESSASGIQVVQCRFPPNSTRLPGRPLDSDTPAARLTSTVLKSSVASYLVSPGYFFDVVSGETKDKLFVSVLDAGQILSRNEPPVGPPIMSEIASFLDIEGFVQDIAVITPPYASSNTPQGYMNELASQYVLPAPKIVVLTNTGLYYYTRRMPFQVLQYLGTDIRPFSMLYGRKELCSAALSIASSSATDISLQDIARRVYLEMGGRPHLKEDGLVVGSHAGNFDGEAVLSGRFEGLATFLSRLVRDIWKRKVVVTTPSNKFVTNIPLSILRDIQLKLFDLDEFLRRNATFIDGMIGPSTDGSIAIPPTSTEETALFEEHRALYAVTSLLTNIREALDFVTILAENQNLEKCLPYVSENAKSNLLKLTFEEFFDPTRNGLLVRELVSGVVDSHIASGYSVDNITDILRERCGSFCSAGDALVFKALECLHKAESYQKTDLDLKSQWLQEGVRVLKRSGDTISLSALKATTSELVKFGNLPEAVDVILTAAHGHDRGNQALGYFFEGKPGQGTGTDNRESLYDFRIACYNMVFEILDKAGKDLESVGDSLELSRIQNEVFKVVFSSMDELFHYCYYDWLVSMDLADRLLEFDSPFVASYLEKNAVTSLYQADLLWRYFAKKEDSLKASQQLLALASSDFDLSLEDRIEFLSRARGFASGSWPVGQRQAMSDIYRTVQETLDIANIQADILLEVQADKRFADEEKRQGYIEQLNKRILPISDLFNLYADPFGYGEICLAIFQTSDFRRTDEIMRCWERIISKAHSQANEDNSPEPYQYVASAIRHLGERFRLTEFIFSSDRLVPMLERYQFVNGSGSAPGWIVDAFLDAGVVHEQLFRVIDSLFDRREHPFDETAGLRQLAQDAVHTVERWFSDSRGSARIGSPLDVLNGAALKKYEPYVAADLFAKIMRRFT
ncbi:hypothetical protein CANCADRAFT_99845 [Tortispora caseinolytica NRRL Y-17796]|uniref:Nucleoporin Nup133/Nup155-like N-terminal domain-containing protein n=1 Tax=Tortispora caseinolytica NRRL Y-17796 TaxID=767744 RepID=A0A1E4TE48_9ASCO|nr:hypothetical protein CANCADRAFT_99845 [Tortispora caseinolytica NRRL Y-17796]